MTPDEARAPHSPLTFGAIFMMYGWPTLAALVLGAFGMACAATESFGIAIGVAILMLATVFIAAPINAILCTVRLMKRLPRRARSAPLLLLIPKSFALPALAGVGAVVVSGALAFGACLVITQ